MRAARVVVISVVLLAGTATGQTIPPNGGVVSGTTDGGAMTRTPACATSSVNHPEVVYTWTQPATNQVATIRVDGGSVVGDPVRPFRPAVYVLDAPNGTTLKCDAADATEDTAEVRLQIGYDPEHPVIHTYYIVVDGSSSMSPFGVSAGDYSLSLSLGSTYGSAKLVPDAANNLPTDITKIRYRFRVEDNPIPPPGVGPWWKIIFGFHGFWGLSGTSGFEANVYNGRRVYQQQTTECLPAFTGIDGEASLWFSIQDNTVLPEVGTATPDPGFFPTHSQTIDGLTGTKKHEHVSQLNINGHDGLIEIERLGTTTEVAGYNCRGDMTAGTRYIWRQTLTLEDSIPHSAEFLTPPGKGTYFSSPSPTADSWPTSLYTEAFYINYGLFRAYYWGFEYQAQDGSWLPISRWTLYTTDADQAPGVMSNTWGYRLRTYGGHRVIEVSNDDTPTYLRQGETLDLAASPECGDGIVDAGSPWNEECDDGNNVGGDSCNPDCTLPHVCGDRVVDSASPWNEECDDGNGVAGDGCEPDCKTSRPDIAKIFYGNASDPAPRTRGYSTYANNFITPATTVAGNVAWQTVLRSSPATAEWVAAYVDAVGTLRVLCYDGQVWQQEWSATVGGGGTTRRFDVAYETSSGDVIVLYSGNVSVTNELRYRTKPRTSACGAASWSSEMTLNPLRTSGTVEWVKLAWDRRPTSDLMTALWADTNGDLSAMVWSGTAWGNEPATVLENDLQFVNSSQDVEDFDVEYESISGDVMVVWGKSVTSDMNGVRYATCNGGSAACMWSSVGTPPSWVDDATHLDLSSNPNTDEMVFASVGKRQSDLQIGYWSGSAWTNTPEVDDDVRTPIARTKFVACGWLIAGTTTRSIVVYHDTAANNVGWVLGSGGAFTKQGDFTPSPAFALQKHYDIQMDPFGTEHFMLTVSDANDDLFAKRLVLNIDGSLTWTNADGGAALETSGGSTTHKFFSFAYRR